MKVACGLLVTLAVVFGVSQSSPLLRQQSSVRIARGNGRTPTFTQRRFTSPFIVNGEPADIQDFPHHLALLDLTWGGYICGASVLSVHYALSAAHCLEFDVPAEFVRKQT